MFEQGVISACLIILNETSEEIIQAVTILHNLFADQQVRERSRTIDWLHPYLKTMEINSKDTLIPILGALANLTHDGFIVVRSLQMHEWSKE